MMARSSVLEDVIVFVSPLLGAVPASPELPRIASTVPQLCALLESHGATIARSLTKKVTHVLASAQDAAPDAELPARAATHGVPLVRVDYFLDSIVMRTLVSHLEETAEDTEPCTKRTRIDVTTPAPHEKRQQPDEEEEEEQVQEEKPELVTYPLRIPGARGAEWIIKLSSAGEPYCSCPGWRFNRDVPKTCKHLQTLAEPGGLAALGAVPITDGSAGPTRMAAPPPRAGTAAVTAPARASLPRAPAPAADGEESFPQPMKLEHIDVEAADAYLCDDAWVAEQKIDGIRCTVAVTRDGRHSFGSSSGQRLVSATAAQHFAVLSTALPAADADYTLDGELLWTGEYHVFDLLRSGTRDMLALSLADRRRLLEALFDHCDFQPPVYLLPQATDTAAKRALMQRVERMGGEGIVLKLKTGKYRPGARSRDQLKVKFRKTCDCVVTARNQGRQANAVLAVYDAAGVLRQVGKCSMIGKPDAQPGDVVEVAYLYATDAQQLYQPSLVRLRPDKAPRDCLLDQLVPVNKRVLKEDELDDVHAQPRNLAQARR